MGTLLAGLAGTSYPCLAIANYWDLTLEAPNERATEPSAVATGCHTQLRASYRIGKRGKGEQGKRKATWSLTVSFISWTMACCVWHPVAIALGSVTAS